MLRARGTSSARTARGRPRARPSTNVSLGVAFPDDQAQILPYHRTVEDLAGLSPQKFLGAVTARFRVREGPLAPPRKREVGGCICRGGGIRST